MLIKFSRIVRKSIFVVAKQRIFSNNNEHKNVRIWIL